MPGFLKVCFCFCCALFLSLCPSTGTAANAASKLKEIFTFDMLEVTIPYFESKYGPAKYHHDNVRTYDIDGCSLSVYGQNDIDALKLEVSPACSFDLDEFIRTGTPLPVDKLTFGQFEDLEGNSDNKYMADCLHLCGNAVIPSVFLRYFGPRALNYIEIELEVSQVGPEAVDAANAWAKAMIQAEGEDYVIDGKYNKDSKYDQVARQAFKNVPVTAVTVGHNLPDDE